MEDMFRKITPKASVEVVHMLCPGALSLALTLFTRLSMCRAVTAMGMGSSF